MLSYHQRFYWSRFSHTFFYFPLLLTALFTVESTNWNEKVFSWINFLLSLILRVFNLQILSMVLLLQSHIFICFLRYIKNECKLYKVKKAVLVIKTQISKKTLHIYWETITSCAYGLPFLNKLFVLAYPWDFQGMLLKVSRSEHNISWALFVLRK